MEFISFFSMSTTTLFTAFAILISFLFCLFTLTKTSGIHDKKTAPEAKGSRPLLGHLHLLGGPEPVHLVLAKLADACGPIFTIRLGVHRAIVANTWEIAKDCLSTHDRTFATRPKLVSSDLMSYNYAMFGFSPYGPFWRHIRKISTLELLSSHRIELFKHVRESEVQISVKDAYDKWRNKVAPSTTVLMDMKRWFGDIALNIIFRMIIGKRYSDEEVDEKTKQAMRVWFELAGQFVVSDGFPFLRWLDIGGHEKVMKRTSDELDRVMQRWLDEHKSKRKLSGDEGEKKIDGDFMDVLLSTLEDNNKEALIHTYDGDTVNKATSMTMILAASDTTAVTMIWALSLLLNHKECLKKVQQELDTNIGRDMIVKESDLKNLPYLQAVIKETMRLYPPGPLAIPHEATEDCTIQGYAVPKGTRLLLNIYKIQRDSRVWSDPDEFKPERFLTTHKDFDVRGKNFEFIPFGSGRRMCPGILLALPLVGHSLASFLQAFEVQVPGNEPVDMTEAIGISNLKATPLDVLISPRLPEFVYQ